MTKFRAYRNYSLLYNLEERDDRFLVSVEKSSELANERSAYIVSADGGDMRDLLCRLWRCGITPMSLAYVLEDEGYITAEADSVPALPTT